MVKNAAYNDQYFFNQQKNAIITTIDVSCIFSSVAFA